MTEGEIDELIRRFLAAAVPAAEFTHAAHLVVGLWHVRTYSKDEALAHMREGIRRLNEFHGTPNTDTRGYHETITHAYLVLIADFVGRRGDESMADAAQALLTSALARRGALLRYYSEPLLLSATARRTWVEPDLQPLPAAPA